MIFDYNGVPITVTDLEIRGTVPASMDLCRLRDVCGALHPAAVDVQGTPEFDGTRRVRLRLWCDPKRGKERKISLSVVEHG